MFCRVILILCIEPFTKTLKNCSQMWLMVVTFHDWLLHSYSLYLLGSNFLRFITNYMKLDQLTISLISMSYQKSWILFILNVVFHYQWKEWCKLYSKLPSIINTLSDNETVFICYDYIIAKLLFVLNLLFVWR